jgi:hypothetical protein
METEHTQAQRQSHHRKSRKKGKRFRALMILGGLSIILLIAMVAAVKLLDFGPRLATGEPAKEHADATDRSHADPHDHANLEQKMKELRAKEDSLLNGYAWVDKEEQIARIPVDRAMALIAKSGIPKFEIKGAKSGHPGGDGGHGHGDGGHGPGKEEMGGGHHQDAAPQAHGQEQESQPHHQSRATQEPASGEGHHGDDHGKTPPAHDRGGEESDHHRDAKPQTDKAEEKSHGHGEMKSGHHHNEAKSNSHAAEEKPHGHGGASGGRTAVKTPNKPESQNTPDTHGNDEKRDSHHHDPKPQTDSHEKKPNGHDETPHGHE